MGDRPNYQMIALQIGDMLKYDVSLNEIDRAAMSVFNFQREDFPKVNAITSSRAKRIYDWIMTLGKQKMDSGERDTLLKNFLTLLVSEKQIPKVEEILEKANAGISINDPIEEFYSMGFHGEIIKNCLNYYKKGDFFHAVFEAVKIYEHAVKEKSKKSSTGTSLMEEVWSCKGGVLKVTKCETTTEKDIQEGLKNLSVGLIKVGRNPTAHEPANELEISKQDCLDLLSLTSFLLRKLDQSVYYPSK